MVGLDAELVGLRGARLNSHPGMTRGVQVGSQARVDNASRLTLLAPLPCSTESQIPKSSDPLAGVAGVNVRDAFAASRSFTLMAADYSQIEVRPPSPPPFEEHWERTAAPKERVELAVDRQCGNFAETLGSVS